jgi:hypothetical protein
MLAHDQHRRNAMRHYLFVGLVSAALTVPFSARAEITVMQGEYAGGVLIVRGETSQPNQRITLDDRYTEWTDDNKRFRFRIRYLPADCIAKLEAGRDVHPIYITNCEPTGASRPSDFGTEGRSAAAASPSDDPRLRVVRQPCDTGGECQVVCREGEFAINAFCPAGGARLVGERTVSCDATGGNQIVAYCMSPEGLQAQ